MDLEQIALNFMRKADRRCRIGWIDWSSDSWDWKVCRAKAWRIISRRNGRRISYAEALHGKA